MKKLKALWEWLIARRRGLPMPAVPINRECRWRFSDNPPAPRRGLCKSLFP